MPPFDSAEALCIGFFFGSVITWLLAHEYWQRKLDAQHRDLCRLMDALGGDE